VGLSRLLVAWMIVGVWLLAWEAAARLVARGGSGPWLRAPLWHWAGEALLLVLLAALWFASLGGGGWWLVFVLVGTIREWPDPGATARQRKRPWRELGLRVLGIGRIVAAGGMLAWRLGPA
jgi:hypothetical protein